MNNEDMSEVFEKLSGMIDKDKVSPDMVNNLFSMLNNNSSSNENNSNNTNNNTSNIDIETIMKMKNMIDKMNIKDDPRSTLLNSLKPYLKESRKSKVDQYIQLMNMSKLVDFLPFMGGENKQSGK